jgi:hypothetical protein
VGDNDLGVFQNLKTLKKEDVCVDPKKFEKALCQVEQKIKDDWKKYQDFKDHTQAYKRHCTGQKLTVKHQQLLTQHQGRPPVYPVKPVRHMLILDDCQGSNVYTTARASSLNHLTIKHRHVPVTICFLVQSWVGCPRTIRLNATHYCLFRTADTTQLDQIYSAFGGTVTREVFDRLYTEATKSSHGFLFIDVTPKEEDHRFREGFDLFLVPEGTHEIRKVPDSTETYALETLA